MQFFSIVNEDLFRPLTWADKQVNVDILSLLWDVCRRRPQYASERSELADIVASYLQGVDGGGPLFSSEEDVFSDPSDSSNGSDARLLANAKIRMLEKCGWLIKRTGGYEDRLLLALNPHTVPILQSFAEVVNPRLTSYKGKLFGVYSLLSQIRETRNPYELCLDEASRSLMDLTTALHQLDASIEEYIDELTRGKTPEEVLACFEKYEDHVVVGSYHRFKTSDNLFRFRDSLYESIDICDRELKDAIVKDYMDVKRVSEQDARRDVSALLHSMREALHDMEAVMGQIDRHHIEYRRRAVLRAQFLLLSDSSVNTKISDILKVYVAEMTDPAELTQPDETFFPSYIRIFEHGFIDEHSLRSPSTRANRTPIAEMKEFVRDKDEEARRDKETLYYMRIATTQTNVNQYADKMLSSQKEVSASTIFAEHKDDLSFIFGLRAYEGMAKSSYKLKDKNEFVVVNGVRFRDFTIAKE